MLVSRLLSLTVQLRDDELLESITGRRLFISGSLHLSSIRIVVPGRNMETTSTSWIVLKSINSSAFCIGSSVFKAVLIPPLPAL